MFLKVPKPNLDAHFVNHFFQKKIPGTVERNLNWLRA